MTTERISKGVRRLKYGYSIGIEGRRGRGFSSPVDLAFSKAGKMYVASRDHMGAISDAVGVRIGFCNPDFKAEYFGEFGGYGDGDGEFIWPTALAFDKNDVLYLADEHLNRITLFDTGGKYLGKWGTSGDGDGSQGVFAE